MKKRLISIVFIIALIACVIPSAQLPEVSAAKAMSNASALTPIKYNTGSYVALGKLTIYTSSDGKKSTGKTIPLNANFKVTSVKGEFGKTTCGGKTGWVNLTYAYNAKNTVDVEARLNMLRKKFPEGKYWNKPSSDVNNPDGYTNTPCANGHSDRRCNYFDGTCQCHGFSIKLGFDVFGIHPYNWERHYDVSKVKVGDLIRYRGHHTVMITGVYKTYFTVADCNWLYHCGIEWDRKMDKSYFSFYKNNKSDGVYHCPTNGGYIFKKATATTKAAATTTKKTTTTTKKITTTTKKPTTTTTQRTTTTTRPTTTTTTTTTTTAQSSTTRVNGSANVGLLGSSTKKYVFTTKLSVSGSSTASFFYASGERPYVAEGVTKDGKTTFTLNAPAGTYPEVVIMVSGCEEYSLYDFNVERDSFPATVRLVKAGNSSSINITSQPYNVSVNAGADATFAVRATGDGLKYQWYYKKSGASAWTAWNGRIAPTFTVSSNDTWNNMQVRCVITDASGKTATSATAKVKLVSSPVITRQPADVKVKAGADATFSVKASGQNLKYEWLYMKAGDTEWRVWNGRIAPSYTVAANDTWNKMIVRCVITNASGESVTSAVSNVTLVPEIKITAQPANVQVKTGADATFSVKATGSELKYQWYYKKAGTSTWQEWKGRTAPTFKVASNNTWNGMAVYCKITDSAGYYLSSKEIKVTLK